jgi:hypothetical protein
MPGGAIRDGNRFHRAYELRWDGFRLDTGANANTDVDSNGYSNLDAYANAHPHSNSDSNKYPYTDRDSDPAADPGTPYTCAGRTMG